MIRINNIKTSIYYNDKALIDLASKELKTPKENIKAVEIFKRSVDARRKKDVHFLMSLNVVLHSDESKILQRCKNNNITIAKNYEYVLPEKKELNSRPVIIGAGPAGLFCALILSQCGVNPIVIERGKDVEKRQIDIDNLCKNRILNINSNIQFGEGGAGTFSDGKLNTGIKNERCKKVLEEFVNAQAPKEILYNSKPHIGTDKLPIVIKNIRNTIIENGGKFLFETTFVDFTIKNGKVDEVTLLNKSNSTTIKTDNLILATGHSARDVFEKLKDKKIFMEQKAFSVGARIEHLQKDIDKSQYGDFAGKGNLSSADYKLSTHLKNGRSVYTFCMCPGGTVVPAMSEENSVVTNGMSEFARDKVNSNSAVLVSVTPKDFGEDDVLSGIEYQRKLEKSAFIYGGSNYNAPVQKVGDFLKNRKSNAFGNVKPTYKPDVTFSNFNEILPEYVSSSIALGLQDFNNKIRGFSSNDALLTGVETRSSSPVRITRNEKLQSISVKGLYPCGEGAGYAGGIMSAAVDGIKCAEAILNNT